MEEIPFDQLSSFYRRHDSTGVEPPMRRRPRLVARPVDRRPRPVARPVDRSPSPTRFIHGDLGPSEPRDNRRSSPTQTAIPLGWIPNIIRNQYDYREIESRQPHGVNYNFDGMLPLEHSPMHSQSTSPETRFSIQERTYDFDSVTRDQIGSSARPWESETDQIFRYFTMLPEPDDESNYPNNGRQEISFLVRSQTIFFNSTITCDFDLQKETYLDLLELIRKNGNCYLQFTVNDGESRSLGPGSTRQVYKKCMFEMLDTLLTRTNCYFMDINEDHEFWKQGTSCEMIFTLFIAMCIKSEFVLPYHLPPLLLKLISRRDMSEEEILFYAKKLEPDAVQAQLSPEVFKEFDTGYDTQQDFYKSILHRQSERKLLIYKTIADLFTMVGAFKDCKVSKIDNLLSGPYILTPDMVLSMMRIISDQRYKEAWQSFVRSLTEEELKQLLVTLGNTISTKVKYDIYINNDITVDVVIQTCQYSLSIKEYIFDNKENLANLKCYLMKDEKIRG